MLLMVAKNSDLRWLVGLPSEPPMRLASDTRSGRWTHSTQERWSAGWLGTTKYDKDPRQLPKPKRVPSHDADDLAQAMLANLDKECGTITRWELFVVVVAFTIIISDRDLLGRLDYGCCCLDQRHLIKMRSSLVVLQSKRQQQKEELNSLTLKGQTEFLWQCIELWATMDRLDARDQVIFF